MPKKVFCLIFVWLLVLALAIPAGAATVGPLLRSKDGMVVAANPHAARVGAEILEKGGNAVDAAVAVSFALGVVEPYASGLGGEGYAVLALSGGRKVAVDFRSTAPAKATYENLQALGKSLNDLKFTPKGACVPGVLATAAKVHGMGDVVENLHFTFWQ